MAEGFLAWNVQNLEVRVRNVERRLERRELREIEDPFELPDTAFHDLYRLSPQLLSDLIDILYPRLQRDRPTGLSVEKQVFAAVRFYATGCYQRPVGEQWGISMSQSSISRSIRSVTNAINHLLLRPWIRFPVSELERQIARQEFQNANQPFEGAIGAIDCSHISILAPKEHEEGYVNHHGNHSINVQMICDPNLKILNVNARYPGARNDSYIWSASPVRRIMQQLYDRGERGTFLIGDQGYPLEPWLMTPLPNEPIGTPRFLYNQDLCSARNCVERLFGVMKSSWRCLSRHRILQYEPGMAGKIVNACAVLHNMRIQNGMQMEMIDEGEVAGNNQPFVHDDDDDDVVRPLAVARRIQDRMIRQRYGV